MAKKAEIIPYEKQKKEMVDEHLMHVVKNTTPFQRLVWLKKSIDFWKKMEIKRQSERAKPIA